MNFYDKFRDFLYDSVDYLFMIAILIVVVGVIGWRLDVLFEKDAVSAQPSDEIIIDNSSRQDYFNQIGPNESESEENDSETLSKEESQATSPETETDKVIPQTPPPSVETIKVVIPDGSILGKIALILEDSGLITSSRDFIAKAVELKLETQLKSGTYNIEKDLPLEDIVKIMTN